MTTLTQKTMPSALPAIDFSYTEKFVEYWRSNHLGYEGPAQSVEITSWPSVWWQEEGHRWIVGIGFSVNGVSHYLYIEASTLARLSDEFDITSSLCEEF